MKNDRTADYILIGFFTVPVIWLAILIAPYMDKGLIGSLPYLSDAINHPFSFHCCEDTLKTVFIFLLFYGIGIGIYYSTRRNYRRQEEYGSAKWANPKTINKKYADKDSFQNKILSQNVRIGLNGKKHRRNLNTLVIGGSGAGKTRFYGKPNIMQCNTSYVILDPKGGAIRSRIKSTCAQLNI